MGFLLRMAFWFSLVLLVLPFNFAGDDKDAVNPIQAFSAASRAVTDIAALCQREPDVCETGKAAFHTISVRARESARIAYEMIEEEPAPRPEDPAAQPDAFATGSVGIPVPQPRPSEDIPSR